MLARCAAVILPVLLSLTNPNVIYPAAVYIDFWWSGFQRRLYPPSTLGSLVNTVIQQVTGAADGASLCVAAEFIFLSLIPFMPFELDCHFSKSLGFALTSESEGHIGAVGAHR